MQDKFVAPILKWAGGKRQLLEEIFKYIPNKNIRAYYEPFLGGGAVLFKMQPKRAIVNDTNSELINVYNVVKNDVYALINDLKKHENTADYYYKIREKDRAEGYRNLSDIERASRIIYLNKTCYNGLFRVNNHGEFNVPFGGYKNPNIINERTLLSVSKYLNKNNITLLNTDFEEAVKGIRKDSFVYFDPPYYPISDSSSFTGYTLKGFDSNDQIRLKKVCDRLNNRGIKFLLSNSSAPFIIDLYKDYKIEYVRANRNINSLGNKRGEIIEILVRNYECD